MTSPGSAYWKQRFALKRSRERLVTLSRVVEHPGDLTLFQSAQLLALILEFQPDLILELGRGYGNSTCVFVEAANQLPAPCQVVSLCDCACWQDVTLPKLKLIMEDSWFKPLLAIQADIVHFGFDRILDASNRVLIFWDAHGFDIAECVLGKILRLLAPKEHVVALHDMLDLRYNRPHELHHDYLLWKGSDKSEGMFCAGNIYSKVPQTISVLDFAHRNGITLESVDHSNHSYIGSDSARVAEMHELLGDELFHLNGYWYWFSLNEHPGPYYFPIVRA